jgi:hypothetical protein
MRCCGRTKGSAGLFALLMLLATHARAASLELPSWAWGAQFAWTEVHFLPDVDAWTPGLRANLLKRVGSATWLAMEGGAYQSVYPPLGFGDDIGVHPLDRDFSLMDLSLTVHTGPAWAYRPYLVTGIGMQRVTGHQSPGAGPERVEINPSVEVGAGVRGGRGLLPWFEWRFHGSLHRLHAFEDIKLSYYTLGIGLGWN